MTNEEFMAKTMPKCKECEIWLIEVGNYRAAWEGDRVLGWLCGRDNCWIEKERQREGEKKMRGYKVGDQFVIEIGEEFYNDPYAGESTGGYKTLYKVKGFNSLVFDREGLDRLKKVDEVRPTDYMYGYKRGQEDLIENIKALLTSEGKGKENE